eukprot:4906100-Prymnesium_polylepis.2
MLGGGDERCRAVRPAGDLRVSAVLQQRLHNLEVAALGRHQQRRRAVHCPRRVHVGARHEQALDAR